MLSLVRCSMCVTIVRGIMQRADRGVAFEVDWYGFIHIS